MKALIALSGGVDSSVAAYLMQQTGYSCIGCTMKLFENRDAAVSPAKSCCSLEDVEDARRVAFRLGMRFYVFNFTEDFREKIIGRFIEEYQAGRTPNPCIDCNRQMKFGKLWERAQILGYDKIVTGHYARIHFDGEKYHLLRGLDASKDQSYVLYDMTQEQLAHTAFPLGEMTKEEVRRIAREQGFLNATKPDSQDICFVPEGDYAAVIAAHTGQNPEPGDFVDEEGRVLGRHKGIIHYTIGQRKGLGLSLPAPLFVLRIDPEKNEVILGPSERLFKKEVLVKDFHWISGETPAGPVPGQAKLRYRQKAASVKAIPQEDGSVLLQFDDPQRAPTPGQSAVLYDGDEVLGGGIII